MLPFRIITPDPRTAFTIGRQSDSHLQFDNLMVSRNHAVIEYIEGKWNLQSLTQNSVTMVNGNVIENVFLKDGDTIHIGPHQLRVTLRNNRLTLLVIDRIYEDNAKSEPLASEWSEIEIPGFSGGAKARIVKRNANEIAEIRPSVPTVNERGKSVRCIRLRDGESCRFPTSTIEFKKNALIAQETISGFDVSVRNLQVNIGKKKVLDNIDFDVSAGEILAVIGRSGQGKSTLLKLLQGLHKSSPASLVKIGGVNYRNKEIRKRIAVLPQNPLLRMDLTVEENILDGAAISMNKADFKKDAEKRAEKFCELFGLSDRRKNLVKTLSGGELRRAALARELMGSPGLILLDEPLSGLDPYNSKILCAHLKELAFLGHTIILTTHSYEALQIANKVLVLHQGREAYAGTVAGALAYFKASDPESILSALNEEDLVRWAENPLRTQNPTSPTQLRIFEKSTPRGTYFHTFATIAKQWFRDKGKLAALFAQPLIIGFLLSQIFSTSTSLWTVSFALILCANWFALSLSIREIVAEKDILHDELRKGKHILRYLAAKLTMSVLFAFAQTSIVYAFVSFRIAATASTPQLALILLSIVLPAVATGLFTSALSKNAGQANAFLPLVIIPQIALAGALVPVDQMQTVARILSYAIWSRYNQSSLQNALLHQEDNVLNMPLAFVIALSFYIVTAIILYKSRKAK